VVEDEVEILNLIEVFLGKEGYRVVKANSKRAADIALSKEEFEIVVIDIGLPDGDGLELVKKVRTSAESGIIVISGRGELADRVLGLELGADDYIVKPFHVRDIVARVRAVGRRISAQQARQRISPRHFCGYEIDKTARVLKQPEGTELSLTAREFDVLWALVESSPRVLTRESIVEAAFGRGYAFAGRPVDGLISRLREKLFPDGSGHLRIRTVRGRGYQLVC
jgi:DNA-binding response OmpR family regulator